MAPRAGWRFFWRLRLAPGYGVDETVVAAVGIAVFLGHVYPVFFGFHGGKGVATVLGILLALNPWLGLAVLGNLAAGGLHVANFFFVRLDRGGVHAALRLVVVAIRCAGRGGGGLSLLLMWRHKSNIQNLLSGKEHAIGKTQPGDAPPQ